MITWRGVKYDEQVIGDAVALVARTLRHEMRYREDVPLGEPAVLAATLLVSATWGDPEAAHELVDAMFTLARRAHLPMADVPLPPRMQSEGDA